MGSHRTIGTKMGERSTLSIVRYQNMLNSGRPELHKLAAKRIFFEGIREISITRLVGQKLLNYNGDKDTKKWLKKSLCTTCKTYGSRKN